MPNKTDAESKYIWCIEEIKKHFGDTNVECSVSENDTQVTITVSNDTKKTSIVLEWQPIKRVSDTDEIKLNACTFDDDIKNRKVLDNWISEVKEMWSMK